MPALPWATLRTLAVLSGGVFVLLSLGTACLDYADEDWGKSTCAEGTPLEEADGGVDAGCDATVAEPPTGSGSGSAAP